MTLPVISEISSSALHAIHGLEIPVTIRLTTLGISKDAFGKTLPTTVRFKLNSLAEKSVLFSVLKSADTAEYSLVAHTLIWWREYLSLRVLLFIVIMYMSLALHSVITPMIFHSNTVHVTGTAFSYNTNDIPWVSSTYVNMGDRYSYIVTDLNGFKDTCSTYIVWASLSLFRCIWIASWQEETSSTWAFTVTSSDVVGELGRFAGSDTEESVAVVTWSSSSGTAMQWLHVNHLLIAIDGEFQEGG